VLDSLKTNEEAKINQDQYPISYYYNFVYWISHFHSGLAKFLTSISKIEFSWIAGFFVLLIVLGIVSRKKTSSRSLLPLTMAVAGFSLMAAEIIIIFAFQVFYGYLYYKIGLIITALMIGMALGTWLGIKLSSRSKKISGAKIKSLILIHGSIIVFCLVFLLGSWFLFQVSPKPSLVIEIIFLSLAALIGGIVGFEFPIINELYLNQKIRLRPSGFGGQAGTIYGADLLGSCLGASLTSIFILPIFGIFQTLILIAILNVVILISLFYLKSAS
jgi:spermidine synthase